MDSKTTHPTDTPLGTLPPRTRAALCLTEDNGKLRIMNLSGCGLIVRAEFARTLETELNEATALLRQKDEALRDIEARANHCIPYHAYGDNEAANDMSNRLGSISECAGYALALTPKSPTP